MIHYSHQRQFKPFTHQLSTSKRKYSSRHDRVFHLPTIIAQNDPFLRRLYGVVALILDDHPYPSTPEEFNRRTEEIKRNVQDLNLSPYELNFFHRLIKETGVTMVHFF